MEYDYFVIENNEIQYQTYINNLLITPYTDGICVNFDDLNISLNCDAKENNKIIYKDKIIKFENNKFYIGVAI